MSQPETYKVACPVCAAFSLVPMQRSRMFWPPIGSLLRVRAMPLRNNSHSRFTGIKKAVSQPAAHNTNLKYRARLADSLPRLLQACGRVSLRERPLS